MSSFRTARTPRARLVGAAATVVLAALSLTACNDGTGVKSEGRATGTAPAANGTATAPSQDESAAGTTQGSGTDTSASGGNGPAGKTSSSKASGGTGGTGGSGRAGKSGGSGEATASGGSSGAGASGKPVTCEGSVTRTTAAPLTRPVNHMLLTVTNTGSRTCFLYGYPAVRFGEAQAVPPVIEDSQPQAVVTLEPGQSGYASVNLAAADGSGTNGHTVKSLTVHFQGRSGNGSVGTEAHPSLPAQGVYVDDSLKVTYWQQSMDDAVSW
ncbi:DUF4232 domain-containing protein [Streptomyces longwoodensis]|uniref:DUF4232 domain-containing protein n=1 Tax=Streptomyces longwoodensis TaxID=68231 RepID=UPI0033A8AAF8